MHEHLWINPTHFECWQKVYIQFTATAFHQNVTPGKSKYSIFFISLFFFKLTHQKFSFLHIKKTSCLCNSLIYRERGFLFWLHPGPNAWLRIKLPLSIIPLLWNLSFRFWMPVYFVYLSHNRSTKDPSIVPVSRGSPLETLICINFLLMTQIYTGRSKFLHSISLSCQQKSREILHLFLL